MSTFSYSPKLLIVGLDGATFDNLGPWIEAGKLPTFKKLLDGGVHGTLRSTFPPVTAPAWTSFMTGKNPGKHGLYHFIEPQPGGYDLRYTNARSRRAPTLWRLLNQQGLRVGAVNIPMTYPPEPVDGFMLSGMDAPEDSTTITHPESLYGELKERFGQVSPQIRYLGYLNSDDRREGLLKAMAEMDEHYVQATEYLLEKHPVDVAMLVFTSTDTVQHFFYQYYDPQHPQYDAEGAKRFGNAILSVYERLDKAIARLMSRLPEGTPLVLMSDHGFRSTSGRVVHLNRFLQELGLLTRKPPTLFSKLTRPVFKKVDTLLRTSLGPELKARIAGMLPALRRKWEAQYAGFADVDWSRTQAYCYEVLTFPPGIWVNRKGTRPEGVVADGPEYDQLLALLTEKLLQLKDPVTGKPLVERVYRKEEIYSGAQLAHAPDLTVSWWDGVTFLTKPSFGEGEVVEYVGGQEMQAGDWGGGHALNGMCVFHGKPFQQGVTVQGAEILDISPTVLHVLGLPVPADMDGKVLTDVLSPEHAARPVVRSEASVDGDGGGDTYTSEESDKVAERLRALGYIE